MFDQALLLIAVLAPTFGSLLLPVLGRLSVRWRNLLAFCLVAAALVCSMALVPRAISGQVISAGWLPALPSLPSLGDTPLFRADALAVFTACVSSLVSAIVVLY